jgi:Tfp pilus assembly protein PilP
MKSLYLIPALLLLTIACSTNSPDDLAKKRIYQRIDADAMGMIPDLEIVSLERINDTTYKAAHTFTNPMINNKRMRITRNYYFTADFDSIINKEEIFTEMESAGEWIKRENIFN